jgi:hypothetical protein
VAPFSIALVKDGERLSIQSLSKPITISPTTISPTTICSTIERRAQKQARPNISKIYNTAAKAAADISTILPITQDNNASQAPFVIASEVPDFIAPLALLPCSFSSTSAVAVWLVLITLNPIQILTADDGLSLPGIISNFCRESAVLTMTRLVSDRLRHPSTLRNGPTPVYLVGEWVDENSTHLILTAGVVDIKDVRLPRGARVKWCSLESLPPITRVFAQAAVHSALALRGPVAPLVDPVFRQGLLTHKMIQHLERPTSEGWETQVARAHLSLDLLRAVFTAAAKREPDSEVAAQLWLWRDRVPQFSENDVPINLRDRISVAAASSTELLPETHAAYDTVWLPPLPPQPVKHLKASSMADLLLPHAFKAYQGFMDDQCAWLQFFDLPEKQRADLQQPRRPLPVAINECDFIPEARGLIWDLRTLDTGHISTLDYTAPVDTGFNGAFFRERLAAYPDQELLGFLCEGVQLKVNFPRQLVLQPHLLSLEGRDAEVVDDLHKLESDTGWIRFYDHMPFLPCRVNGKGVVPKKGGLIRPIDEAGGPRKALFDSASVEVLSLNWMAEGRELPEAYDADTGYFDRALANKWPKEVKMNGRDIRQSIRVLRSAARAANMPLYAMNGDMHKWFNQFGLGVSEYWKSVHAFRSTFAGNRVMTFGVYPASGISQRGANALVFLFLSDWVDYDALFLEEDCKRTPALRAWFIERRKLGPLQHRLLHMMMYTDDPLWFVVGADRMVRCVKLWMCFILKTGLIVAGPEKHSLGIDVVHCGIRHLSLFGLQVIPERKALTAIEALVSMLAGSCESTTGRARLGLLEHCRYACGLRTFKLFPIWACLPGDPAELMVLSTTARVCAEAWVSFLQACNGSAVADVRMERPPSDAALEWHVHSDAALTPLGEAGLGGFFHGLWWRLALDERLLQLTISPLELLASGVSLIVLFHHLGAPKTGSSTVWIRWCTDSLCGAFVLRKDASTPLMRHLRQLIVDTRAFRYFEPALILCHEFGPANPADAPSRNKIAKLQQICRSVSCASSELTLPDDATKLIDDTVSFRVKHFSRHEVCADGGSRANVKAEDPACNPPRPDTTAPRDTSITFQVQHFSRHVVPIRDDPIGNLATESPPTKRACVIPIRDDNADSAWQHPLESASHISANTVVPVREAVGWSALGLLDDYIAKTVGYAAVSTVPVPVSEVYTPHTSNGGPAYLDDIFSDLTFDSSPYALCRNDPDQLHALCTTAHGLLQESFTTRTNARDRKAFARWSLYCRALGTTPWRDDIAANMGSDHVGHHREIILMINFLIRRYQQIRPRPGITNRTRCKPQSAIADLQAVRRVFKVNCLPLITIAPVVRALKALTRRFLTEFGRNALTPNRAAPFTNAILDGMFAVNADIRVGSVLVKWDSFLGLHLRALLALSTCTGMRLSELVSSNGSCCVLRGSCSFVIAGKLITNPTVAQLAALTTADFLVILPPPSKSDQFGIVWGSLPIYVPFRLQAGNAAALVAQIFMADISVPSSAPLFMHNKERTLNHTFLRRLLPCWLRAAGVPERQLAIYRWHSARVFLACALLAAGRRPEVIQALLRWQSVESLRLYACLGPAEYAAHLDAARTAHVTAIRAAHIPFIDSLDLAYHINAALPN